MAELLRWIGTMCWNLSAWLERVARTGSDPKHPFGLFVPFLDESESFANGVEVGILFARMRDPANLKIDDLFLLDNQEQIHLMAHRLGWRVMRSQIVAPGWCRVRLLRKEEACEKSGRR